VLVDLIVLRELFRKLRSVETVPNALVNAELSAEMLAVGAPLVRSDTSWFKTPRTPELPEPKIDEPGRLI
jgi:hypothetical protein